MTDDQPNTPQDMTPAAAVQAYIDQLRERQNSNAPFISARSSDEGDLPAIEAILGLERQTRVEVIRALLDRIHIGRKGHVSFGGLPGFYLKPVLSRLLQKELPFSLSDLILFLDKLEPIAHDFPNHTLPVQAILRCVARYIEQHGLPDELRIALEDFQRELAVGHYAPFSQTSNYAPTADERGFIEFIDSLLGRTAPPISLESAEPWVAALQKDIGALPADSQRIWRVLLDHLHAADGSKPTRKWLAQANSLIESLGRNRFQRFLTTWLPLVRLNRSDQPPPVGAYDADKNLLLSDSSETVLKGLAWAASLLPEGEVATALGDLGETCWKKIPMYGPRSKRAGNAALWALSSIGTPDAVAQLMRVNAKLRHASAQKLADKAMNRVSQSTGQTREDMEEIAFPTFGLDADGVLAGSLGDFSCILSITPECTVSLGVTDSQGTPRKTIPAELKKRHAEELKSLRRTQKEIQAMLTAQRARFESMLRLPDRRWTFADWQSRYVDHPIVAAFARRLIWTFTVDGVSSPAMFLNNHLVNPDDSPLELSHPAKSNAIVRLWHPVAESLDGVRIWRRFIERHRITQPFKQAHREIYLLTDAERRTGTYSNRFAAHIIRQHQFNALCAARGWNYKLQGSWDGGGGMPTLTLPAINLQAEFWVEPILGDNGLASTTGVAMNLSTDQVRCNRLEPREQLSIEAIPPQVFSEVMRDVDLFIGVCSIGNDPTWSDGGPEGHYRDYWHTNAFGDLSASAGTRREILATLLPRLAIADQCSLEDKFLRVEGSIRTYKIHLGSGNILMEPNDQYLCIVTDRSLGTRTASELYLPFEGDSMLGVILSKAFLLAADTKITDPTIVRQIRGG